MKISQVGAVNQQQVANSGTEAQVKARPAESSQANSTRKYVTKVQKIQNEEYLRQIPSDSVEASEVDDEILSKSIEQANKSLDQYNRVIERSVHDKTHTIMYTVKDSKTGEVIQEFPPKKIQDMIAKMWELAGLFVDERA